MHIFRHWLLAFTLLAVLMACNLTTSAPPTRLPVEQGTPTLASAETPASTPVSYQPVFESAPCAFPIPEGHIPECGYLVVPENRMRADSLPIRLHVAVFRSRSDMPVSDPVVHLAGGPGSSSIEVAGYMFRQGLDQVLDQRDLILFDQRGTGYSLPRLDCPERTEITATLLLETGLASGGAQPLIVDAFRRCHDRLVAQGVDLSAYTSAASADDLNDLRLALGYEKLNLYGVSYGTRLALTLMRDHPEAVRSVVLDSTYPLQVNLYTALAPNAERAFNVFFDRCAADANCAATYPDLRGVFYQLVDQLNTNPVSVSVYPGGVERTVRFDGGLLIDVLFVGLYNPAVTASMPHMIYEVRQGDYTILRERLGLYFDSSGALGMQMAVQCAEEFPFSSAEEAYMLAQGRQPQIAAFYPASIPPLFEACKAWTTTSPDARENQSVQSNLPALVLAGEHDPITPPEWGRMVAVDLSNAYFHEFPGNGHWVTRSSRCALQMSLAFWQDPTVDPAYACQ